MAAIGITRPPRLPVRYAALAARRLPQAGMSKRRFQSAPGKPWPEVRRGRHSPTTRDHPALLKRPAAVGSETAPGGGAAPSMPIGIVP
jgi:hypothetical protein